MSCKILLRDRFGSSGGCGGDGGNGGEINGRAGRHSDE